jgi:hypothetical protein
LQILLTHPARRIRAHLINSPPKAGAKYNFPPIFRFIQLLKPAFSNNVYDINSCRKEEIFNRINGYYAIPRVKG